MSSLPYMRWFPGDWQRDQDLQSCSLEARGLWAEMLWIMHQGQPRGYLALAAGPVDAAKLAKLVRVPTEVVERCIVELEANKVFSRDDSGIIYNRRMVRDSKERDTFVEYGKRGGNPALKAGDKAWDKAGDKAWVNPPLNPQGYPPPCSTSTATSTATATTTPNAKVENTNPPTPLPGGAASPGKVPRNKRSFEETPGFAAFWARYPRHEAKQDAIKAWHQVKADGQEAMLIDEVVCRVRNDEQWQRDGGRYIPLAATWLRGRRWEDEPVNLNLATQEG